MTHAKIENSGIEKWWCRANEEEEKKCGYCGRVRMKVAYAT